MKPLVSQWPRLLVGTSLLLAGLQASADTDTPAQTTPSADTGQAVEFNADFLRSKVDLKQFSRRNPVPPGPHRVDLYVNEQWRGRTDVVFANRNAGDRVARPCYDRALFKTLGLRADAIEHIDKAWTSGQPRCRDLETLLPGTTAIYDSGLQRLDITAPQVSLDRVRRGDYVDPSFWDPGISAFTLGYDYNAYQNEQVAVGRRDTSQFLGLNFGLNVGAWRLRHLASVTDNDQSGLDYESGIAYARRALPGWRSQVTLGDDFTEGQIMESIGFRGVTLESDERMLPDTLRGFAPTIRAVANTNARVTVFQAGRQIYETNVPPGAFVIDDLYPVGSQADLQVVITEADGTRRTYQVPYAAAPQLLRPGANRYSVTAGVYRNNAVDEAPAFVRGTYRRGVSNMWTLYSGGLVSADYSAGTAGIALNTGLGALAMDVTGTRTERHIGDADEGYSLRLAYSDTLPLLATNVTLASYRYSSEGFFGANDAFDMQSRRREFLLGTDFAPRNTRNQFVLNAAQALPGDWGALYITGNVRDYWQERGTDVEYSAGYNIGLSRTNVGLNVTRARALGFEGWQTTGNLTFSVGFDGPAGIRQAGSQYTRASHAQTVQSSVTGIVGDDRALTYNAFAGYADLDHGDAQATGGGSARYRSGVADIGASASAGPDVRQYGASVSGGVVAYRRGIVFAPQLGDTIGIVEAEHAGGAHIAGQPGIHVSGNGKAVVPYLTPYRRNEIALDPDGLSTNVALEQTDTNVAPMAGAVVLVTFETDTGHSILLKTHRANHEPVPFAAAIYNEDDQLVGHIGQGSQALVRVPRTSGRLHISWGDNASDRCQLSYALPDDSPPDQLGYYEIDSECHT